MKLKNLEIVSDKISPSGQEYYFIKLYFENDIAYIVNLCPPFNANNVAYTFRRIADTIEELSNEILPQ